MQPGWFQRTRVFKLWEKYEHVLGVAALGSGFIFDLFLAKTPASVPDNILLVCYLFIAAGVIIALNARNVRRVATDEQALPLVLLLMLQFCFGGLASNMLILYGKSGTLTGSALFIGMLLALVFGNEFLRTRYQQLRFNIGIYYLLLFTYLIISLPTFIFHQIGPTIFLISGAASLIVISIFLSIVYFFVLREKHRSRQLFEVSIIVGAIFILLNGFYFLNIIPPVPLSIKTIGVYHSVSGDAAGNYVGTYEASDWFVFWRDTSATYTYQSGQLAYCFTAVYAPPGLATPVYHVWEHYNEQTKQWDTIERLEFSIVGGRAGGYRGYSIMSALTPGQWRCDVETAQGGLIGRLSFTAVESPSTPTLSTMPL
jgi:hypothetical protein